MTKKDRFNKAYDYLKSIGVIHTQKDVAEKMEATAPNVSSALKGVDSVLTDKFLSRFNEAFGKVFNDEWLMTGEGDMLRPNINQHIGNVHQSSLHEVNVVKGDPDAYNTLLRIVEANQKTTEGFQRSIERFQDQVDKLIEILQNKLK